eukprot:jgi/Psemu1/204762/e_gw1.356.19.1
MPSIQHQTRDHRDAAAAAATPIAIAHHDNNNNNNNNNHHHNRCVLLFDMDCFYAQCERVRLGLPLDVELCLFQWNSVLAVTYPARKHGIKRGDSWDDVAAKTKNTARSGGATASGGGGGGCYTIHLPILGHNDDNNNDADATADAASYKRHFVLSPEERARCLAAENGRRRFHHQGKACLERYRLASTRIFGVVLESLEKRITQESENNKNNNNNKNNRYSFLLERASIDEFYLDLTDYCYRRLENTVVTGQTKQQQQQQQRGTHTHHNRYASNTDDGEDHHHTEIELALNRACEVSRWIRNDIWNVLGFTMSAGISTNKTMAKLAASYGKPNGQAVLYPRNFPGVLSETKVTKVRNFGGKLGKAALKVLLDYQKQEEGERWNNNNNNNESDSDRLERLKSTATMADLSRVPLPFLVHSQSMSSESAARFVFEASHGIDHEAVTNTSGALVKSITAFKSFSATKNHTEIFDRWLTVLANEVVERVARDTVRNRRYPRSCTLNYTYYTTANGKRPSTTTAGGGNINTSTRSQRQTRSLRLRFPSEREGSLSQKTASLLAQARDKLGPIIRN